MMYGTKISKKNIAKPMIELNRIEVEPAFRLVEGPAVPPDMLPVILADAVADPAVVVGIGFGVESLLIDSEYSDTIHVEFWTLRKHSAPNCTRPRDASSGI
jgi:hypothetical protein